MSQVRANSITNAAGTGAPDFPNGLTSNSNAVLNSSSSLPAANITGDVAAARITGALNATGSAPIYACRAWVNFNGTGTVAIRASGNVSSITDNGTGNYTVNFTTAMPDANYAVNVTGQVTFGSFYGMGAVNGAIAPTTTAVSVLSLNNVGGAALSDATYMNVSIFR